MSPSILCLCHVCYRPSNPRCIKMEGDITQTCCHQTFQGLLVCLRFAREKPIGHASMTVGLRKCVMGTLKREGKTENLIDARKLIQGGTSKQLKPPIDLVPTGSWWAAIVANYYPGRQDGRTFQIQVKRRFQRLYVSPCR